MSAHRFSFYSFILFFAAISISVNSPYFIAENCRFDSFRFPDIAILFDPAYPICLRCGRIRFPPENRIFGTPFASFYCLTGLEECPLFTLRKECRNGQGKKKIKKQSQERKKTTTGSMVTQSVVNKIPCRSFSIGRVLFYKDILISREWQQALPERF
jgi:hypothetical protein